MYRFRCIIVFVVRPFLRKSNEMCRPTVAAYHNGFIAIQYDNNNQLFDIRNALELGPMTLLFVDFDMLSRRQM